MSSWFERVRSGVSNLHPERRQHPAARAAAWLAVFGAGVGIGVGLLTAAALTASGLTSANLPPLAAPTTKATPTPTPTPTPTRTSAAPSAEPEPELKTDSTKVPPGQRFKLRGVLPKAKKGATLQVQVRDGDGPWDDFPVTTTAGAKGTFETTVYTSRTGERQFRLIDRASKQTTPTLKVTIG